MERNKLKRNCRLKWILFYKTQGSVYVKIYRTPKLLLFTDELCKGIHKQTHKQTFCLKTFKFGAIFNI